MRTAIYMRVSTNEQVEEGYSLSAQKERLTAFVMSQGWDIAGYYVDEGISAKDMKREQLIRMIADVKKGLIDVVLVYRLDRLTRSVVDLHELLKVFDKYNCKFKSATEVYDTTTAIGRLFLTLVAALAQWERENLSERVSFGLTQKAIEGGWHGSAAPFGYDLINKELVINEDEAKTVREMFRLYINGLSDRNVAIHLNKNHMLTKNGHLWQDARVRYVLKNPLYAGTLRWGVRVNKENAFEVEGAFPAIISKETFEEAQKIRGKRNSFHGKQVSSDFIYSGILTCSRCGSPLKGVTTTRKGTDRRKNYMCRKVYLKECDLPMVSERIVEHNFIKYLKAAQFQFTSIEDVEESEIENLEEQFSNEKKQKKIQDDLDKLLTRKKKWQYAWANELLNDEEFKDRMNEENKKEKQLKEELKALEEITPSVKVDRQAILEMISDLIESWSNLTDKEKKQLLQNTVSSIVVEKVNEGKPLDRLTILEINFSD